MLTATAALANVTPLTQMLGEWKRRPRFMPTPSDAVAGWERLCKALYLGSIPSAASQESAGQTAKVREREWRGPEWLG